MKSLINIIITVIFIAAVFPTAAAGAGADDERHLSLKELTVRPTREKYSKKNNPAVNFVRQVMERRNMSDPRLTHDYYSHGVYERISVGIIDLPVDSGGTLGFLNEYVDTTELSGRPMINLSVKEKLSDVYYRRSPTTRREVVRLRNRHGLDDLLADASSMQVIFDDVMRPVDLYDSNDITILRQKFVSPLSRLATNFYKFYLSDTVADAERGDSLVVLSFVPHNPAMPSFNGRLYVVKGDSAMFIRRAEMRMPAESNVNFVTDMLLVQEYERASDGSRLKTRDEVIIEASYLGVSAYASRLSVYNSHDFTAPADSSIFDSASEVIERGDLNDSLASYRPAGTPRGAANMGGLMARLRENKVFYWIERVLACLISDRIHPGGADAPVSIGPIFSTVGHNDLEGWRFRLGGETTAKFSPRVFLSGYGAYALGDRRWKYGGAVEYSFNRKEQHSGEFPIRSLKLSYVNDVDRLGQHNSASGTLFNSLVFTRNNLMTYMNRASLDFTWETESRFSVSAGVSHLREEESLYVPFVDGAGRRFSDFRQTGAAVTLRWAPGEKYYQTLDGRIPITTENPVISLTHTYAPAGLFGTRWGVNKTEMTFDKRWYLSAWGHIDLRVSAGHVWNHTVFPSLLMPNTNLSYFYQPSAFSMVKPLEFVMDTYADLHINYNANGALFNYIPLLKRLKLRELIGFHALWGTLSDRNNPARNSWLLRFPEEAGPTAPDRVPYMEVNAGIGNIFRILSVYYVCRLTHNSPSESRHGVRMAFRFAF